jgi:hypothetical protein
VRAERRWAVGIGALIGLSACAAYKSGLRTDQSLDPTRAYLYGRFFIKSQRDYGDDFGYQRMGLRIRCVNGQTYTLPFINTREVQVFDIGPNRCALEAAVYTAASGVTVRTRPAPPTWVHVDTFWPGRAYYLGDYFAKATFEETTTHGWDYWTWRWFMDPADDHFEATTAEMKRSFVQLAALPVEDRRFAPRSPPPRATVAGPPLSSERVARIVQYTRRRYPTPAACAAVCPTGACVAFRDEAGAAMACIIGCKTDKDCPEGLACNCAGADGPDCRAIAETPKDPMAGICLSIEPADERR